MCTVTVSLKNPNHDNTEPSWSILQRALWEPKYKKGWTHQKLGQMLNGGGEITFSFDDESDVKLFIQKLGEQGAHNTFHIASSNY